MYTGLGGWGVGGGGIHPPNPHIIPRDQGGEWGVADAPLPPPYMHSGVPDFFPVGGNYPQLFIPVHVSFLLQFMCRVQFSRFLFMCLSFFLVSQAVGTWCVIMVVSDGSAGHGPQVQLTGCVV